jgi:hypothetical protein
MDNQTNDPGEKNDSAHITFFPPGNQEKTSVNSSGVSVEKKKPNLSLNEIVLKNGSNPEQNVSKEPLKSGVIFPETTAVSNVSSEPVPPAPLPETKKTRFGKRFFVLTAGTITAVVLVLAGSAWGFSKYEQYNKKVAIEKLMPNNPNLVAQVTIDPDSQQFSLLEQNLEKFPGYEVLRKELDIYGQGKTFSQYFQDKVKESGLDLETDIKPVLGEKAYVVVPDLKPIGSSLKYNMLVAFEQGKQAATDLISSSTEGKKMLASLGVDENGSNSKVLGEEKNSDTKQLDYIIASEVSDMKKAMDVVNKIKKNIDKYEYTELNFQRYTYYKIKIKDNPSIASGKIINFKETFNALLGNNWIISSNESLIKEAIKRQNQNLIMGSVFSKEKVLSLADDKNYEKVNANFNQESNDNFITLYYNINYNDIFHSNKCSGDVVGCDNVVEYIKYPENIVSGVGLRFDPKGVIIKSASNQTAMEDFENRPFSESLAYKIPSQLADRWADVVVEDSDVKKLYYSFKKNNLTEKGAEEWNNVLGEFRNAVGIDLERDFIDITDGNLAFIFLSKKGVNPEGVIVAEISDSQKMLESMKKVVDVIKAGLISEYSSASGVGNAQIPNKKGITPNPAIAQEAKIFQQALADVQKSQIVETDTAGGKIYSYQIIFPKDESFPLPSFSINYSLEDKKLVLSSSYGAVESVLKGIKDNSVEKISSGKDFQEASKYFYPSIYQYSYANTLGIYNAIEYYANMLENRFSSTSMCQNDKSAECLNAQKSMDEESQKMKDAIFAIGAVYRTVKLSGTSSSVDEKFLKSNLYFNIQELPKEEKDRANQIISSLSGSLSSARQKAKEASFKSSASSLVPQMILVCDQRHITVDDLKSGGSDQCIDVNESFKTLVQDCGSGASGTFKISVKGFNDCQGYSADCTEVGCTFK